GGTARRESDRLRTPGHASLDLPAARRDAAAGRTVVLPSRRDAQAVEGSGSVKGPRLLFAHACCAGILCNAIILGPGLTHTLRGENDFLGLYPGGRLAGSPALYEAAASAAVQRQAVGYSNPHLVFCRPPFYAALLWPLSRLRYFAAYLA